LDSPAILKKKMKKAFCEPGNVENNGVLSFTKSVIFPLLHGAEFIIERSEKNGGRIIYKNFDEIFEAFRTEILHPGDLKLGVENFINRLLDPIRKKFESKELKKLAAEAYPSKETEAAANGDSNDEFHVCRLDVRVGRIVSVEIHPEAENLYVEQIDVGESAPRQIVSGLAKFCSPDELLNRSVLVLCNLKPARLKGVESFGMILCASRDNPKAVEPLDPPNEAPPGQKVTIDGFETFQAEAELNPKKKIWERIQNDLKVNADGIAEWQGNLLKIVGFDGIISAKSLKNVPIK